MAFQVGKQYVAEYLSLSVTHSLGREWLKMNLLGDWLEIEDTGAEKTSIKAREAFMENRIRVLTVGMEMSLGLCRPCDSTLIIFFFDA